MRKNIKVLGAIAVAGVVATTGSAFTNSMGGVPATDVLGYGATTVSGATVKSLTYNFNVERSEVDSITLILDGDTSASTAAIGFNTAAPVNCAAGTYDATAGVVATTYTCKNGVNDYNQLVSAIQKTAVHLT